MVLSVNIGISFPIIWMRIICLKLLSSQVFDDHWHTSAIFSSVKSVMPFQDVLPLILVSSVTQQGLDWGLSDLLVISYPWWYISSGFFIFIGLGNGLVSIFQITQCCLGLLWIGPQAVNLREICIKKHFYWRPIWGIVVAHACVCMSVCVTKFGPKVQKNSPWLKFLLFWVFIDLDLQGEVELTSLNS